MDIKKVFIVGSGLMGSGIAQVCAQSGIEVVLNDVSDEILQKGIKSIAWSVGKFVEKGKVSEDKETIMGRIKTSIEYGPASDADLVIEAVFENKEIKKEIFSKFEDVCKPEAYMASNTSAIAITELGAATKRPEKVLGLHFFNPVPMMGVVEVVRGVSTTEETVEMGMEFVKKVGKEPIRVEKDVAAFLLNRINFPSTIEAIRMVEDGIGTVEDIDKGVKLAFGRKMGIFETGDMVGLNVTYGALMACYEETKDPRWYPPQLLRRKVAAGELGRKTGKGWYEYNKDGTKKEKKRG